MMKPLVIADKTFTSRFFIGTGKFASGRQMAAAVTASGSQLVTVALRRVALDRRPEDDPVIAHLNPEKVTIVPNTSGARNADEAVRIARLARQAGGNHWVKLEVTPDPNYLLPDPVETLRAAEILVKDGFVVLPYINADPVLARRLEETGTATVMPLASPIGTNRGMETREMIAIIIEQAGIPVVVDAGLGMPSHAAAAIELGADAVLANTAIAAAGDPVSMARAFAMAVQAAETAVEADPGGEKKLAVASSPLTGFLSAQMKKQEN